MLRLRPRLLRRQQDGGVLFSFLRPRRRLASSSATAAALSGMRALALLPPLSGHPLPVPILGAGGGACIRPFSSSSSSSSRKRPPPPTITKSSDRGAFERLLQERLDEPLGFLDEGTLQMWRKQGPHVACLHYTAEGEDGALLGFLTLYEVERDPLGKHKAPHLLNLIYVQPRHRHRGVAVDLIRHAAAELEVTALCTSEEYQKVCEKAGLRRGDSKALAPIVVMSN